MARVVKYRLAGPASQVDIALQHGYLGGMSKMREDHG